MAKPKDILDKVIDYAQAAMPSEGMIEAAQIFLKKNKVIFCMEEKCFYQYNGCYYKRIHPEEIHGILISDPYLALLSIAKRDVIVRNISVLARKSIYDFNKENCLCLNNGIIYPLENKFITHTPDIINTICLPYNFDSEAVCPLWEKTLVEIFENDKNKIRVLQEFFGYCLTKDTHYEKALMLIGDGRNGKSTVLRVLEGLLGEENCAALSLKHIEDPRMACLLVDKYVNINSEFGGKYTDFEDAFKTIVSGEAISVNPKYATMFRHRPFCKMIFSVNTLPHIEDKTGALYSRLMIISFDRVFEEDEQNKRLKYQLPEELPGILNWVIKGLQNLYERKNFAVDEYMKKILHELRSYNNPIEGFIEDCISIQKESSTLKGEVYQSYRKWSVENGFRTAGANKFGAEFYRLLKGKTKKDEKETFEDQRRIWPNIVLKTHIAVDSGWGEKET